MEKPGSALHIYLSPQVTHVYVQQVRECFGLRLPDPFGERGATHHFTGMTHENFKNRVLLWCQADGHTTSRHAVTQRVELEIGDPEDDGSSQGRAAQERTDASQELCEHTRFGDIVVGSFVEARDPTLSCVANRQH